LSSGSKYENTETKKHFAGLPVVRGEFTAIHLSGDAAKFAKTNARYDDPDYYKAYRLHYYIVVCYPYDCSWFFSFK
jgi:hypothetical protein